VDVLLQGFLWLVKCVLEVILEVVFYRLFYATGWLVLRLLSFGRFPRAPLSVSDPSGPGCRTALALGFLLLVAVPLSVVVLLYG